VYQFLHRGTFAGQHGIADTYMNFMCKTLSYKYSATQAKPLNKRATLEGGFAFSVICTTEDF
jgi:hypothetical protein